MSKNIIDVEENYAPSGDFAGSVILRESGEEIVICEDEWPELRAKIDRAFGRHHKLIVKPETDYQETPSKEGGVIVPDRSKQAIDDMLAIYWSDALDREETLDGIAEILINFEADGAKT